MKIDRYSVAIVMVGAATIGMVFGYPGAVCGLLFAALIAVDV